MSRESLKNVSRIVVKLGTGVLTDSRKQPDLAQLTQLVAQIAAIRAAGKEVVIVSSGAVGAGMGGVCAPAGAAKSAPALTAAAMNCLRVFKTDHTSITTGTMTGRRL